jgi:branched-chain amino acid transport system ATP-binding protein
VWQLYFGLIFIAVVVFAPGGITGLLMMHRPLLKAGTLAKVLPSYLIALVPTLAMIAGLILSIETIVHYTVNPGDDSHIKAFGVSFDAASPYILGDGGHSPDRRISGCAQDLELGRACLGRRDQRCARKRNCRMSAAIELRGVEKSFGNVAIIRNINLSVAQGERHALIGPNGAGKSTTVQPDQRLYGADLGQRAAPRPGDFRPAALPDQPPRVVAQLSGHQRLCQYERVGKPALRRAVGDRHRYAFWKNIDNLPEVRDRTAQILADINLTARRDVPAGLLTYAEQRALEIGITIAGGADVILLDEPTAGMSHAETERAVALIRRLTEGRTLLIVEHDMSVVFGLADRISVLVYGQIIASGTPEEIRGNPKVKEAYLGEEAA